MASFFVRIASRELRCRNAADRQPIKKAGARISLPFSPRVPGSSVQTTCLVLQIRHQIHERCSRASSVCRSCFPHSSECERGRWIHASHSQTGCLSKGLSTIAGPSCDPQREKETSREKMGRKWSPSLSPSHLSPSSQALPMEPLQQRT